MSFVSTLKRLFRSVEANVNHAVTQNINAEKQLKLAASTLCDEIRRLEHSRVSTKQRMSQLYKEADKHRADFNDREKQLKELISRGGKPTNSLVLLVLNKKKLADALTENGHTVRDSLPKLNEAIVGLGDRLDEVKASLDLVRLKQESEDLGVLLPDDLEAVVGHTTVDVDAIIRDVETFTGHDVRSGASTDEIDQYLASLTSK